MALKPVVNSLDEVQESLRDLYVAKDGKFFLDVDGGIEDVSGLKTALEKERTEAKRLKGLVSELEPLKAKEAELAELRKKIEEIEDGELLAKGEEGIKEIVGKRIKRGLDEADAKVRAALEAQTKAESTATEATTKLRGFVLQNAVQAAAVKASVRPTALRDVSRAAAEVFTVGDDLSVVLRDDLESSLVDKRGNPVTLDSWFTDLLPDEAPHYWDMDKGAGGGRGGSGGPVKQVRRDDQDAVNANWEGIASGAVKVV